MIHDPGSKDFQQLLKKELVGRGSLPEEKFLKILHDAERNHRSLVDALYRSQLIPEKDIVHALCQATGYTPINVAAFSVEPEILELIPREAALKYQVLPVTRYEKTMTVAVVDPTNVSMLDDVRAMAGLRLRPVLATPSQLKAAIRKCYEKDRGAASMPADTLEKITDEVRTENQGQPVFRGLEDQSDLLEEANATPIIRFVNHFLIEAIRSRASDIFVEPWESNMRIRYRVDGVLEEVLTAPKNFNAPVISRVKVMSRLNIAEHRMPQDGRFKARIFGHEVDLRVSILPTCFGEKACLRLLDTTAETQSLDQIGFDARELETIRRSAGKPHGMILVTGPTGSGKTTTLYAVLQHLNSSEKNITTVEDPVEYQIPSINQVNVREQVGLTFPTALRSILRQDPDIILIGEIRDMITMDIAIKAALTGHLVLSTLHTNDATSAIVRMIDMGIEPFLIASSVIMISAQRLVRKLCPLCREPYTPDRATLETLGLSSQKEKLTLYRAKGCSRCRFTGQLGRTPVTELFEVNHPIQELIMRGGNNEEIRQLARENGMTTLREAGIQKVKAGITTVEEVLRVTSIEPAIQAGKVLVR